MIKGIGDFIGFGAENGDSKKLLADIFEGLDWIARAVSLTNKFRPGKMCEYELIDKLPELIQAYENSDYVLIGDILDYEIRPVLEKWVNQMH